MADTSTTPAKSAPAPVSKSPAAAPAPASPAAAPASTGNERRAWAPGSSHIPRPGRDEGLKRAQEAYTKAEEKITGQPRAADGTFAPKDAPEASQIEALDKAGAERAAKEQAKASETQPEAVASKFAEGDRKKAETALSRMKVPESALKGMSEDERVQWGLDLAKSQAEYDRKVTELSSKAKGKETGDAESAKAAEQPATTSNLRSLTEALMLDEEGGRLLAGTLAEIEGKHAKEVSNLETMMSSTLTRLARESLVKEFPDLADDDAFKRIDDDLGIEQEKSKYADITDPYELVKACIRNLAKAEFAESMAQKAKEAARKESARRDAGQPVGISKIGNAAKMTKREYALASYKLLEANPGMSGEEVKARLLGG